MKSKTLHSALLIAITLIGVIPLSAQDFRLQVAPGLLIPLEMLTPEQEDAPFGLGGGTALLVNTDILGFLAPYAGAELNILSPGNTDIEGSMSLISAGAGIGLYAYPIPRLKLAASAGPIIYVGTWTQGVESEMIGNLGWRAAAEAGYRISPGLTISAGAGWVDYRTQASSFYQGLALSLVADISFSSGSGSGKASLSNAEAVPVYPISAKDYLSTQFGTLTIQNGESAEIRKVEVWFQAEPYTSAPILCGSIPVLRKGASAQVPLIAAFSEQVIGVTDILRTNGEVEIVYELLGERRSARTETAISIMHRNALTWQDPRILAAFISPNDPAVLDASKFIAGIVRSNFQSDIDSNLQYAVGLYEGFRLAGIAWAADPQTPYKSTHINQTAIDYVQYPHQTIAYRSGDSDDLAILYTAALESVGVPTAFIPLQNEVLTAVKMSSTEAATRSMFADSANFIFRDGEAWIPLKMSMIREGFLRAWSEASTMLAGSTEAEIAAAFIPVSDAWLRYPPVSVPDVDAATRKPDQTQVQTAFNGVVSLVISREVIPRADRMRATFGASGGSGRQRNSLGILYARYGLYREALAEFQAAAALGEGRAAVNIGNVAFLLKDFETAAAWYEKALQSAPNEIAPIIGLARTYYELDMYDKADQFFKQATSLQPQLAERYGYLSARLSGSVSRASAAMDRLGDAMWDE
ncbi:MAG: tetratricopeptide repeat protein [Spirochaetes bacterium]|nr:tetratricopeptide repeat protein [Spirochaetota bacterium]MBU0955639.1 tetratricopeptide repeat protein [Spirochaetota bacterium]